MWVWKLAVEVFCWLCSKKDGMGDKYVLRIIYMMSRSFEPTSEAAVRRGHQRFDGALAKLLTHQPHGQHGHDEQQHQRHESAEEKPQGGLPAGNQVEEPEEIAVQTKEYHQHHVGDRRTKERQEFPLGNSK